MEYNNRALSCKKKRLTPFLAKQKRKNELHRVYAPFRRMEQGHCLRKNIAPVRSSLEGLS